MSDFCERAVPRAEKRDGKKDANVGGSLFPKTVRRADFVSRPKDAQRTSAEFSSRVLSGRHPESSKQKESSDGETVIGNEIEY